MMTHLLQAQPIIEILSMKQALALMLHHSQWACWHVAHGYRIPLLNPHPLHWLCTPRHP